MTLPSLSLVLSLAFMAYIVYSIIGLVKLFTLPQCKSNEKCLMYYLHEAPKLQLAIFTSTKEIPILAHDVKFVGRISNMDYLSPFTKTLTLNLPKATQENGTLYLHLFLLPQVSKIKTWYEASSRDDNVYTRILLTCYQVPATSTYQLLKGGKGDDVGIPTSHLKSEIGINILTDIKYFPEKNFPPELYRILKLSKSGKVLPLLYYDFLNDRIGNLIEISGNSTAKIELKYSPITIGKLRLMLNTEISLSSLKRYGFSDKDLDQVKGIFADTNIYLLSVTIFVSSVHLLFDFLALKNDVSFWKSRRSLAGLSLRTIFWRAFSQVIILFYLLDEETSYLVLGPAAIGAFIELWKVHKVMPLDWMHFKLKVVLLSVEEKKTREIDAEGMHYLAYLLYPLCILSAIYSLLYQQYKSWYSWVIHSLVNGVYAFGFLFMLPQLFINYKLKSVAHLPWRAFMYKNYYKQKTWFDLLLILNKITIILLFLLMLLISLFNLTFIYLCIFRSYHMAFNTFIDDLFAFIISMPTAHRLACFRDDIVFLIYLYQRWLYPVDNSRIDESGFVNDISEKKRN